MNYQTLKNVVEALTQRKAQFVAFSWTKVLEMKKNCDDVVITKTTSLTCRTGVNYENIASTIEGRSDGSLPSKNQGLPWGEWELYPFIITHKGKRYLRLYPTHKDKKTGKFVFPNLNVTLKCNGNVITKEQALALGALKKNWSNSSPRCITVTSDNLDTPKVGY